MTVFVTDMHDSVSVLFNFVPSLFKISDQMEFHDIWNLLELMVITQLCGKVYERNVVQSTHGAAVRSSSYLFFT